jgi:hypothetical protein
MKCFRKAPAVMGAISIFMCSLFSIAGHSQSPAASAAVPGVAAPAGLPAGPVLLAKISSTLNTKNAKAGDLLTAKTLRNLKLADGTELPKGSKLVAKVTSVLSKKAGDGNSLLSFRFDEVDVKGGAAMPIHGMVVAIGPELSPKESIGANSVVGRGGVGSTPGLDPSAGMGKVGARDEDDIAMGSTLEGVALGRHKDADWTTALRGIRTEVDLDSSVVIKLQIRE